MKRRSLAVSAAAVLGLAAAARADSTLSGVCPDGSFFVVQSRESVPCANPHFADPSDLPPVRPYLLPRPYTWYVDQEARNPNNPYNLLETAQKIRDARAGVSAENAKKTAEPAQAARLAPSASQSAQTQATGSHSAPPEPLVSLGDNDLRDLVRLIALRQEAAPASLQVKDVNGRQTLRIDVAYSASFESFALSTLGRDSSSSRVIVWSVTSERAADFHPNFFVVQSGRTFRPDPQNPAELGFLLGGPGTQPAGEMSIGYLVVPASFDPANAIEVFWNDRSLEAVLAPPTSAAPSTH